MSITLEQIDEVINRTGATYHQAKEALQFSEGDVVEAIIYIETLKKDKSSSDRPYIHGEEIIGLLKDTIKKGNVTRITLEKNGKVVVDIPILAGLVGALIFTPATVASILAALVAGCDLKIIKDDGEIIDVKEYTENKVDKVKDKFAREKEKHTVAGDDDFLEEDELEEEDVIILDESLEKEKTEE
ncbi:MAG: DUF4342 domain-containing protein [Clostridia bacterium]|nr:DUF4342 domain-containing protein [Clostridia bacterium]